MKRRITRKRVARKPRRVHKRVVKRAPKGPTTKMTNLTHLKQNMVLSDSMLIKQYFQLSGHIPAGSASGYFDIAISGYEPFTPSSYTGSTMSLFTSATNGNGVLLAGSSLTELSNDYSLLQQAYQNQRPLSAKLNITCEPQALGDTVQLYVIPWTSDTNGDNRPANMDTRLALEPRCKWKICCSNYASQRANSIRHSVSVASLYGVKRSVLLNDNRFVGPVGAAFEFDACYYRIAWLTTDAANLTLPLVFRLNLTLINKLEERVITLT
nr:MAG: capsid protein [Cressdnaviricota sp.]